MALFGTKKNTESKKPMKAEAVKAAPHVATAGKGMHADVIIRPRITEKAGMQTEGAGVYAFEVRMNATKPMIAQAIKALYKVTPRKVNVSILPAKRVFVRGKRGTTSSVKKAMVFLKKGDKISLA